MSELFVIIINFNGKKFLEKCLPSLSSQTYKNFNIIVVDNNSTDGSQDFIEKHYLEILLIQLEANLGFAAANNIAINRVIEKKEVKYFVLLNNDTVCDKSFLNELVLTTKNEKSIGMVASRMLFLNRPEYINNAGGMIRKNGCFDGRGFNEPNSLKFNFKKEVFAPSGGAGLYIKEMLLDIKYKDEYFDESFFAYHEDIDIAWRARLMGWRCFYAPSAVVYHHHSATFTDSSAKRFLCVRNNISTIYKCMSKKLLKKFWGKIFLYNFRILIKYLFLFDLYPVKGIIEGICNMRQLKKKRRFIQSKKTISDYEIEKWWGSS